MKSKKLRRLIGALIVTIGLIALNYPLLAEAINNFFAYRERQGYQNEITAAGESELERRLERARAYNAALASGGSRNEFADFELLKTGALLGYLEVPCIDVDMAVRYSTENKVLKNSLGLVVDSSLPVGGESTHAVISGHTGLASKKMFTELTEVKLGDLFFMHVLGQDMAYRVDQIKVVEPWDPSELVIFEGKEYVTLLTCTPYGINDHRLLVRGERIDYDFGAEENTSKRFERSYSTVELVRFAVAGVSVIIFIVMITLLAVTGRGKRTARAKRKRREDADEK